MPDASGPEPSDDPLAADLALWQLLARARRPAAPESAFARRVLREVTGIRAAPAVRRRRPVDDGQRAAAFNSA